MEAEPKFDITSVTERGPESSHADLDELAQRIKKEHSNVANALHQGFMHACAAGELFGLITVKGRGSAFARRGERP